jgi:hypothetical protein
MNFLVWIENLPFFVWFRESGSVWGEPMFLFLHTVGMSMIAGVSAVMDLAILGFWPKVSIKPLERVYPLLWTGFCINLFSGTILLLNDASTKIPSVVFWTKMCFVFCGVWLLIVIRKKIFHSSEIERGLLPAGARGLALASIVCWLGAIEAGRLLAYLGPVSGLPGFTNR